MVGDFQVLGDVAVPEFVYQARGVGGQVANGRLGLGRPELGLVAVIPDQNLQVAELGQNVLDQRVRVELASIDQDHGRRGADRLGHGENPEDGVLGRRRSRGSFAGRA